MHAYYIPTGLPDSIPHIFFRAFDFYWTWVFRRRRKAIDLSARFTMRCTLMLYFCLANKMSTYVRLVTRRAGSLSLSLSRSPSISPVSAVRFVPAPVHSHQMRTLRDELNCNFISNDDKMYTIIVNDDGCDDNAPTQPLIDFAFVVGRECFFYFTGSHLRHPTARSVSTPVMHIFRWKFNATTLNLNRITPRRLVAVTRDSPISFSNKSWHLFSV